MSSVYIHIPFCQNICSYCDFCKLFYKKEWVLSYLSALKKEIQKNYHGEEVDTLYIGGGTPSCLTEEELIFLFDIISMIQKKEQIEFTFECNIENITESKLKILYQYGVNRLSIGVQTFHNTYLNILERHHQKEDVFSKINLAKKVGFSNINVDFMYAFPSETMENVENDIELFLQLNVPHISMYSLILEPHTKLYIKNIKEIDEDLDAAMYERICTLLGQNGYEHYEVSNFCKPGYESLHNLNYWNNGHYYGFGLGASGYVSNIRYENTRSMNVYLKGNYLFRKQVLNQMEIMENEFMLGFRKMKGISKHEFYNTYHKDVTEIPIIKQLIREEKIKENIDYIYINPKYIYVMNEILVKLVEEGYENE